MKIFEIIFYTCCYEERTLWGYSTGEEHQKQFPVFFSNYLMLHVLKLTINYGNSITDGTHKCIFPTCALHIKVNARVWYAIKGVNTLSQCLMNSFYHSTLRAREVKQTASAYDMKAFNASVHKSQSCRTSFLVDYRHFPFEMLLNTDILGKCGKTL